MTILRFDSIAGRGVLVFIMEGDKENQLEVLKTDVWTKLPQLNLEELEQVCTALDLPIEPSKQGRRSAVYSIVTLHLMSNEVNNMDVDMSLDMFGNVRGALDGILTVRTMKTEVRTDEVVVSGQGEGSSGNQSANPGMGTTDAGSNVDNAPPTNSTTTHAASLNTHDTHQQNAHQHNTHQQNTDQQNTLQHNIQQQNIHQNTPPNTTMLNGTRPRMAQQFANLAALASPPIVQYALPRIAPLREFKIGGTVGKGAKDSLSYATVLSRIKQGKQQGYTSNEVMAAVAKSIKSSELQDIVENGDLDEETFLEVLKVHYLEKNSNRVYNDMCGARQKASENEVEFLIRMCGLRKRVEKLSLEEGRPMEASLLRDSFFSSLATGFKQGAVRLELQGTLRNQALTDRELIKEVGFVVAKEQQHLLKSEGEKGVAFVDEVEVLNGGNRHGGGGSGGGGSKVPESRPVDHEILGAIKDLKVDVNRKLTKVQDDVQDLKTRVAQCEQRWVETATGGPVLPVDQRNKKPYKFIKCAKCEEEGSKCFHCTTCGLLGHKRDACPKKNEKSLNG